MDVSARPPTTDPHQPFLGRIIDLFLRSQLTPFLIVVSLIAGVAAILLTPREEEPQIVVPMADVHVSAPGLAVEEIERQIATPVEKLLALSHL